LKKFILKKFLPILSCLIILISTTVPTAFATSPADMAAQNIAEGLTAIFNNSMDKDGETDENGKPTYPIDDSGLAAANHLSCWLWQLLKIQQEEYPDGVSLEGHDGEYTDESVRNIRRSFKLVRLVSMPFSMASEKCLVLSTELILVI